MRKVSLPLFLHPQNDQLANATTTFAFVFHRCVLPESSEGLGAIDFFKKYCSSVKDKSEP